VFHVKHDIMISVEVVVIGGGHAGIEAASASARMGCRTLLITSDPETIGRLSCNPAIGGMAKGQLVKEIDALGGEMGMIADLSGIHFKMLGTSKGPAMWSPRSQNDKELYPRFARQRLSERENLDIVQGEVEDVIVEGGIVAGVMLAGGTRINCSAAILCAGTFLCGRMHTGESISVGGRVEESSAEQVSGSLRSIGFATGRLKTGTPPRVERDSVDFSACSIDSGDERPLPFSRRTTCVTNRISCYSSSTSDITHAILRGGFDRSPMFTGRITGAGPRYCPSIEDKIHRFADKGTHPIVLEPETTSGNSVYVNGFSTSLPADIQLQGLRSIRGLEDCRVLKYGYAVEYDFFPPYQLQLTLESKLVGGLYFAGQVNGTSGYEEAGAQGLVAGINAAAKIQGLKPFILDRSQAYIGVLIDDLVNLSTNEPYRMFTSRAEYRLLLRQDNADLRLTELGVEWGLVASADGEHVRRKREGIERGRHLLERRSVGEVGIPPSEGEGTTKCWQWLKRTESSIDRLRSLVAADDPLFPLLMDAEVSEQLEIAAKYGGYIDRQIAEVARFKESEAALIPEQLNYESIKSLSSEGREKLARIRPGSLGQAARISGVSRSDLAVLMLYIR
jgi:tRNA uridine 5-carboxymethylaminomethyl modification enzyme